MNPEGIAFYNDLINELVAHNITPIVTLYHYDLPVWVDELGGWKSRDTVEDSSTTAASALRTSATGSNTGCR